jgi:polyhydroxybutyrate depolymerase
MDFVRRMTVAALVALAATVLAAQAGVAGRTQAIVPAGLVRQTWSVDGVQRSALVAAPRAAAAGDRLPLVLVFHGHGGTSANAARTFRIHEAWPEAVVIYPQGVPTVGALTDPEGRLPGWQSLPGDNGDRDLRLTEAMLEWAKTRYPIDPAKVFAAGHSNGGSMVYLLWAVRGDRFAAFAPSASVFRPVLIARAPPKPALIIAGREDALVPFASQQRTIDAVLRLNHAAAAGAEWSGEARMHASPSGADVVIYIHPGGHPMPADAGEQMARFFRTVARRLPS